MDLKNLLGKLDQLNEADMASRKIAGKAYGGAAQHDDDEDEGSEKKAAAPAVKRGRGRPRKAGGEADTSAKYSGAKDLQSWIVGSVPKKPSKELSKLPATKHKLSDKEPEKKKVKESLKDWIAELDQLMEAEQLTIEPAKASTQVIKQGSKVLGQVSNPQLAATIKQAIGKGEMSLAGTQMREEALDEKWDAETKVSPEEKGKYEGKSKAELLKAYNALKKSGPHKKGSPEFGKMRELAFAIRAKSGWGKVAEADIYSDGMNSMGAGLGAGRSDSTLEAKQGVAEGLAKDIKRAVAGWGAFDKDKPADVVKRVKGQGTDTLKALSNPGSTGKGSPAELQQKAIRRELKKRGEQGVAEGSNNLLNLLRKYRRNEDNNLHSENVVLLAQHFGTPNELQMAKQALAYRNEQGGFDYSDPKANNYIRFQQEINKKYYPLLKRQGVAEGSEWETRHDEFVTVGDRATPEQINKIVSALGVAAKQARGKRGFLNQIIGKQSNGDLARMAHVAETLAKNIQRNSNAKPGTDERKELGQHLVYAVSLLKRMSGGEDVAEAKNHMGETEYNTYAGWKSACRKAGADKFEGDSDICQAMKDGKGIGEWDGATGSVYDDSHKKKKMAEGKSSVKHDDKAEKAGKKVAKDIEYDEKVKDKIHGKKRHAEDEKAERAGKKVAKDIEYDEKKSKKKVDEGMDQRMKAAHHRGKAHALAKEGYNCRYDEGSEEARMYHEGYKMGLDECYGIMPMRGVVVGEEGMEEGMMGGALGGVAGAALGKTPSAAMTGAELGSAAQDMFTGEDMDRDVVDDMASFGARHGEDMEEGNAFTAALAKTPKGGKFSVGGKTFTDKSDYNAKVDEMMMAFEGWDKQLNELLTEGDKVDEGMSISVSKGQQGLPDSVSVTASDAEADKLMALVKQLGVFGAGESHSDYGAPKAADSHMHGDIEVVDDHAGMLALMKSMAGNQGQDDYADEETHEEVCEACGSADCECESESQEMIDEVESEDQMTYVNLEETNPPDSGAAEVDAEDASVAAQNAAGAAYNPSNDLDEGGDGGEASEEPEEGMAESEEESLEEAYANGADDTFEADIDFMTKIISSGLNKQKSTGQTTIPVIAGQSSRMGVDGMNESNDSIADWKKLSGIK